jgi:hypothetical protein
MLITSVWQDALSGLLFWLVPAVGAIWQRDLIKEWVALKHQQHRAELAQEP